MKGEGLSVFIPACLEKQMREEGEEGAEWLDRLPERIAALEREWGFRAGPSFDHTGCVSWVAPIALEGGSGAVLKIGFPHDEARFEGDALRLLDGDGAVRLLRASDDGFALLLERCLPGADLWALSEEEGDAVAADLLPRLWRELPPSAPFKTLATLIDEWCEEIPPIAAEEGYDVDLCARSLHLGRELAASASRITLLHGDFHPGNVLAAQREPWLIIDPKPLIGDPAYDLAQWLSNRYDAAVLTGDPVSALRGQIDRFAARLGLDPARIAGWALVKAFGWEWGPEATVIFRHVYEAW